MELTAEQIAELQQKAKEADELKERLEALAGNKDKVLDEKKQLQARLKELEDAEKTRKEKELEEQGKLKELLDAARQDAEQARKEAEEARKAQEELSAKQVKERLRADFMAAVGPEVFKPEHLWPLFQSAITDAAGKTVVTYKGSELSPAELAKRLRSDPDYAHHFKPSKSGGQGAPRGGSSAPDTGDNPYITGNVTAQIMLQLDNPEEAARMQAEAKAALAARAKAG
jgi:hypothetical protein